MTRARLSAAAGSAGFEEVTFRSFGATPPALTNRRWGRGLERALESVPGWSRVAAFRLIVLRCAG